MGELFLGFVNKSISAGWLVLAVVILRPLLKKSAQVAQSGTLEHGRPAADSSLLH